jgi:GH35 family endo-1,4-beta-xylanase
MHIDTRAPPQLSALAASIKRLGELGLQVHITEMDVRCQPPCDLDLQGDIYASIAAECLKQSSVCTSFTTWGFTDLHTWLWTYVALFPSSVFVTLCSDTSILSTST